ncbi:MAG: polysaccharide deacetylase family sporulation protein PdaB [Firmicutes bacterium]|nr:polysaccharide deacetylase family sporulation protein PdaB [Bacillota bacterium]
MVVIMAGTWKRITLDKTVTGEIDRPIYLVPTSEKAVALTFDISWGERSAGPILDILKEHQVQATFFLSGPWAQKHPELVTRIVEDGHELASHGHRHINYSTLTKKEIKAEVEKAQQAIYSVSGIKTKYIRTPNGDYNAEAIRAIREAGHTAIQWSLDSKDWLNPGVKAIIDQVFSNCQRGAIILMHASDSCNQTHLALPEILKGLKEKGYAIKTVGALLESYQNRKPPLAR